VLAVAASRRSTAATKTGTGCVQSAHGTTSPVENLAQRIEYIDSFTAARAHRRRLARGAAAAFPGDSAA
jgi:hypothetical protein